VVEVMNVVMMMVVVMMVMMHLSRRGSGRGSRILRHGVAGEAKRENGRGGQGLDHWRFFLWLREPKWVSPQIERVA
jgi:hypothetical protein